MLRFVGALERVLLQLGTISGFATLAIMLIVMIDVTGRAAFNAPLPGGLEMSELLLVALIFFGFAAAQQRRQNFSVDILTRHLPAFLQRILDLLALFVGLGVAGLLAWFSAGQAVKSYDRGEASFGIIPFPIWPARFVLAFGLVCLTLQLAIDIVSLLSGRAPRASAPLPPE